MSLHTSFLRVIRHHDALSRLHSRLPLKLTGLQTHCRPHASSGDDTQLVSQPETQPEIDLVHHQSPNQLNHKALETLPMAPAGFTAGRKTKLTCPSPTTGARGLPRFHDVGDEEPLHARRVCNSQTRSTGRSTSCASFPHLLLQKRLSERTTSLQSLFVQRTTMEPLPHGLWSCSSKPLTGRTGLQAEGRFSSTGTTGDTPFTGTLPQPDKDSSYVDDMPCRHPLH